MTGTFRGVRRNQKKKMGSREKDDMPNVLVF